MTADWVFLPIFNAYFKGSQSNAGDRSELAAGKAAGITDWHLRTKKLWGTTQCHESFHLIYCDFFFPTVFCIQINFCEVPLIFMDLVLGASQAPSSCVMNTGGQFHLTLQQFPSSLIVLRKQQSWHSVTGIVPYSSADIICFFMVTMHLSVKDNEIVWSIFRNLSRWIQKSEGGDLWLCPTTEKKKQHVCVFGKKRCETVFTDDAHPHLSVLLEHSLIHRAASIAVDV